MLVRDVATDETDDERDKRDASEKVDSGLEPMEEPVDMVDGRRLRGARIAGQCSTLATLTAGVYERGGVDLGVGSDATAPTKAGVGGPTSGSGSRKEGRLAKGVCTGAGSETATTDAAGAIATVSSSGVSRGITSRQVCLGLSSNMACPGGGGSCDGVYRRTTSVQRLKT